MRVQNPVQFAAATAVRMVVAWSVTWFVLSVAYKLGGATVPLGVVTLVALGAVIWQMTKVKADTSGSEKNKASLPGRLFLEPSSHTQTTQYLDDLQSSPLYSSLAGNINHHNGSHFDGR